MKPTRSKRTKRSLSPDCQPVSSGGARLKWGRGERKALLNALKKLRKNADAANDIDYAALKKSVPKRSLPEIEAFVDALKNKVISHAFNKLNRKKYEDKKAAKPIEAWTDMASKIAGKHEPTIFSAFSQLLIAASTEPCTLMNRDPPQMYWPPTDKSRPIGRTVPYRPLPHLPVKGNQSGKETISLPLVGKTQVSTTGPNKTLPSPVQVVVVPNVPPKPQPFPTAVRLPAAASPLLGRTGKIIQPSTYLQSVSQNVKPVTSPNTCTAEGETQRKDSSTQLQAAQQACTSRTSKPMLCSPKTFLCPSVTPVCTTAIFSAPFSASITPAFTIATPTVASITSITPVSTIATFTVASITSITPVSTSTTSTVAAVTSMSPVSTTATSTVASVTSMSPVSTTATSTVASVTSMSPVSTTATSAVAASSATNTRPEPPFASPVAMFNDMFGRTSKYATKDSPRVLGLKCVVDFERIYRFLSVIHKPNMNCQLTPMESAVVLDLLMSLPEEVPLLKCYELKKHLVEVYECLSASADRKNSIERLKNLRDRLSVQTDAQTGSSRTTKPDTQQDTAGPDRTDVTDGAGESLKPDGAEQQGASESNNANGQSGEADIMEPWPPLNPFLVPLKLLKRKSVEDK